MTEDVFWAKAERALASARVLLGEGDVDGAVNRAYYAMFGAARALLAASGIPAGKTHSGLIAAFGERFVKDGPFDRETGRMLKRAETMRNLSDYEGISPSIGEAEAMIEGAERFVGTLREQFEPSSPAPK